MFWDKITPDAWAGIVGAILGAVAGWGLSTLDKLGRMKIQIVNVGVEISKLEQREDSAATMTVGFIIRIVNDKPRPFGINSVAVTIKRGKSKEKIGIDIFGTVDEINEFKSLLNVPAKETREAEFRGGQTILFPERLENYEVFVEYKFNGKKMVHRKRIYKS